jgi:hypothetical protein
VNPLRSLFALAGLVGLLALAGEVDPGKPAARFEVLQARWPVASTDGHVWAVRQATGPIHEWDGKQRVERPLPPHDGVINSLLTDNRNRVWAMGYEQVFLWQPNDAQWQRFPNFKSALEQCLQADPQFCLTNCADLQISFSGDGRVVMRETVPDYNSVVYFDGHSWRKWPQKDVPSGYPQFDDHGIPVIHADDNVWQFDGIGWWLSHPDPARVPPLPVSYRIPEKIQMLASSAWRIVADNDGGFWFTLQGQLFRARAGLRIAVLGRNEAAFCDDRSVRAAAVDRDGNVFLMTNYGSDCVWLPPLRPRPTTAMQTSIRGDSFQARLEAHGAGKHWFVWRLDDGNWSDPTPQSEITLDFLPNGNHTFEARAIDDFLQVDLGAARKEFSVAVDRKNQVTAEITQLFDQDFAARNRAIIGLAEQPDLALPALKQRRTNATDAERWWIDAAIQEVERAKEHQRAVPAE